MPDVQIAITDQQDTQAVLAVPGVQGPAGPSWPSGGTTAQVLAKQSNTTSDFAWQQISNASVASGAAIAHDKLAAMTAGQVLLGNDSNVPTSTTVSGDITITSAGLTAISTGVIVDADVSASAAIALSKLATGPLPSGITVGSGNIIDGTMARIIALEAKVAALEDQDVMLLEG